VILTREFLVTVNSCLPGYRFGLEHDLIGKDYEYAINYCRENGGEEFAIWLEDQKKTEAYVRLNGENITMGAFQVFNPLIGSHVRYETEAEARAALVAIAKEVLKQHCPHMAQELSNENGDTTWILTTIHEQLVVTL